MKKKSNTTISLDAIKESASDVEEFGLEDINIDDDDHLPGLFDDGETLVRSNQLILSRFKGSMIGTKLMLAVLYTAQTSGNMEVLFSTQVLIDMLNMNENSSVYSQIRTAAFEITNMKIWVEDPNKERFAIVNLFESAVYDHGLLRITLTEYARRNITNLKKNFSSIQMKYLMSFGSNQKRQQKTNYSLRLYEILHTHLFKATKERGRYSFKMLLTDLRLSIGVIDPSDPGIRNFIQNGKILGMPDTDLEKYAENKESIAFSRYAAFNERVLRPAQKEICSKTDLCFDYKEERVGRGHVVVAVIFTIWRNPEFVVEEDADISLKLIRQIEKIIDEPIKTSDIENILSAAGNDLNKVRNAYELSKMSKTKIRNLPAWLIAAIREQWKIDDDAGNYPMEHGLLEEMRNSEFAESQIKPNDKQKKKVAPRKKYRNEFNNFPQNEYDFEQLEKEILSN